MTASEIGDRIAALADDLESAGRTDVAAVLHGLAGAVLAGPEYVCDLVAHMMPFMAALHAEVLEERAEIDRGEAERN